MRLLFISLFVLSFSFAFSQNDCKKKYEKEDYVPKNLNDAVSYLECQWSEEDKAEFKSKPEEQAVTELHFGTGQAIRNNWNLWKKGKNRLELFFNIRGISHPDDISSIILTSFHRHLNQKDIELKEQIDYYKSYWEKAKAEYEEIEKKREEECEKEFLTFEIGDTVKIEYKVNVQNNLAWIYRIQKYPKLDEEPNCYVTAIVKKKKKNTRKKGKYTLTILVTDICGHSEAVLSGLDGRFRVGEVYDFFSLMYYKISKK